MSATPRGVAAKTLSTATSIGGCRVIASSAACASESGKVSASLKSLRSVRTDKCCGAAMRTVSATPAQSTATALFLLHAARTDADTTALIELRRSCHAHV